MSSAQIPADLSGAPWGDALRMSQTGSSQQKRSRERPGERGRYSTCVLIYYCAFLSLLNLCWGREKGGKSQPYQTLRLGECLVKN